MLQGTGTKTNENYSGRNLRTHVDENGVLQILLDKELLEDRIDVGSALANPTDSRVNYPVVLGTDSTDANIGYVGINGRNGTSAVITAYAGSPIPGSDFNYTDSEGKTKMTRLEYTDQAGHTHHLAPLTDGLTFGGDNSKMQIDSESETVTGTNVISRKLRAKEYGKDATTHYLQIKGGADAAKLSDSNIGVQASTADGSLTVKLSQELTGLTSAHFGTTTIDGTGLTLGIGTQRISLTANGLNNGGQKVTNMKAGDISDTSTDAIIGTDNNVKGLIFTGDTGHLGDTLQIFGGTDTDSSCNITTRVGNDGILYVNLNRQLQLDGLHIGQKDSSVASLTTETAVQKDGTTSTYGMLSLKGVNQAQANITTTMGTTSLASSDPTTRLTYSNGNVGNAHEIATLEDGLRFTGDNYVAAGADTPEQNVVKTRLDQTLHITGGQTDADSLTDLTDKNIGVVAENGGLSVRLAKVLDGMTDIYMGDTREDASHLNKNGLYLSPQSSTEYVAKFTADDGISAGNQTINDVADGVKDSDAATYGQLKEVESKASKSTTLTVNHGQPDGNLVLTDTLDQDGIHHTYDVALNDKVQVGSTGTSLLAIGWQSAGLQDVITEKDKGTQTGNYITGLSNTSWNSLTVGYSPSRAATEGQLRDVENQVWENPITFLGNHDADKTAEESQDIKATLDSKVRIIGTGTGEAGDFDASNFNVIVGKILDGTSDALIIQMKKAPSFTTVYAGTPDAQGVHPVSVGRVTVTRDGQTETVDGVVITDGPMITKDGINNYGKQITHLKSGGIYDEEDKKYYYDSDEVGTNAATIQDVKNIAGAAAQSEVEAQKVTVSGVDDNITVTPAADNLNHYQVQLSHTLELGQDSKNNPNILIDGENGKVTVGSGSTGNNSVIIDGSGGTVTIGNGTSCHKKVTISGNDGTISGLTNKTLDAPGFATQGRAATEEQLKQVADTVSNLDKAASRTDYQLVGEKDQKGNYTGNYQVSDGNQVKLHVQDSMHPDQVKDITIDNVAKASDLGDVSQISDDIWDKDQNTVVGSLNKLNEKVKAAANGSWESQIDGKTVKKVKAGDVQNFTSGDNIQLSNDNGAIQIATKKDVSFDKVTIGSGDSQMTLDKDGIQAGQVKVSTSEINAGGNRIQGVADGKEKDDAATVGQVAKVADAAGTAIDTLGNHIHRLDRRINKVGAGAAALAALHPDPNSDDDLSFSAGIGNYRGSTAAAIGAFYRPSENVTVSMGATVGNGENMVNAGVTIGVGEGVGRNPSTRKDMIREISQLKEANAAREAEVRDLKKQVQTLQKQNEDMQEKLKRIMEKLGI